jgi:streptogramin lyase
MMLHAFRITFTLVAAIGVMIRGSSAQDNPYRVAEGWAQFPDGRKWGSTSGVDVDRDGNIWAFERCGERTCAGSNLAPIFKFDRSGKPVKSFGAGMFVFPHGMHVDKDGNVWVTDAEGKDGKGHQVVKFNPDGKVLLVLGKAGVAGDGPDTFNRPSAVVTAPNGDIFVADGHGGDSNARIVKFSKDGKFIKAWGKKGTANGEFAELHAIALDSKGRLFVGDRGNSRIQIFDQDGNFLEEWKQFGRPERDLYRPERHNLCGRFPVGCEAQPRVQTGY